MDSEEMIRVAYIKDHVSKRSLYGQLAEEACELAQAAMKGFRKYSVDNPTPVSSDEVLQMLREEAADIMICLDALGVDITSSEVMTNYFQKLDRWVERLKESGA